VASHEPAGFLRELAPHILAELKPPAEIKNFTTIIPFITVAQFMRRFNIWHVDDHASDEALTVAIVLTIFLLVLKIAGDTEQIKNSLSSAR
jgi:hypothetical protein